MFYNKFYYYYYYYFINNIGYILGTHELYNTIKKHTTLIFCRPVPYYHKAIVCCTLDTKF